MRKVFPQRKRVYQPFWLPRMNYYALSFAFAVAVSLIVWGVLHGEDEEFPIIAGGISFFLIVFVAVIVRSRVVRRFEARILVEQEKQSYRILRKKKLENYENKFTLEKNQYLLDEIKKKSEAAKVLGNLADAHLEVFELCSAYLKVAQKELDVVKVGSPRLIALKKGQEKISKLHHFHLLSWAATESRNLTQEAQNHVTISEKVNSAQKALAVLEAALAFYPKDFQLNESVSAVKEFIFSVQIKDMLERAEEEVFKANHQTAISLYRDALFFLARENEKNEKKEAFAEEIKDKIEKLRKFE